MKHMSIDARALRKYHGEVRKFKDWCNEHGIKYFSFEEAPLYSICILSRNEYDLYERKRNIEENSESYFISEQDYDIWYEEKNK